tara:strand:- start:88 stop:819 length:732 start_codon:yes stop_codon:yes gene_type:complete
MIIQLDAKGLEIVCGAYLSQDEVLMKELIDGVDIHSRNQKMLGLPEGKDGRLVAKIFVFRLMYGGGAWGYANDPAFSWISSKGQFWQDKIDDYYSKYKGFAKWHNTIVVKASREGKLVMPTGRVYHFPLTRNKITNELEVPERAIKNYPVQGLGADVMSVARVSFFKRWKDIGDIKGVLCNTVHDSIVCDIQSSEVARVRDLCHSVFSDLPDNFGRVFGKRFNLPLCCEVLGGDNMTDMEEIL